MKFRHMMFGALPVLGMVVVGNAFAVKTASTIPQLVLSASGKKVSCTAAGYTSAAPAKIKWSLTAPGSIGQSEYGTCPGEIDLGNYSQCYYVGAHKLTGIVTFKAGALYTPPIAGDPPETYYQPGLPVTISNPSTCCDYANTAIKAQQDNIALGCGFQGAPWNPKGDDHYNWCEVTAVSIVNQGTTDRTARLASCKTCNAYADAAVAAQAVNVKKNCGGSSAGWGAALWNSDRKVHFDLCIGSTAATIAGLAKQRSDRLATCK